VPKPSRPSADESLPSDQRPIFIPDERPQLGREPGQTDLTFIPGPARFLYRLLALFRMSLGNLLPTFLEHAFAVGGDLSLDFFDEGRQRRLGISRDCEIRLRHGLEILNVTLHEEIQRADTDTLRTGGRSTSALDFEIQHEIGRITLVSVSGQRMARRD